MSQLREECGVFGVYSNQNMDVARMAYYGLFALQHRGQESCGIVVNDDGLFRDHKDVGLVGDVFNPTVLDDLGTGNMAIGHVRYSTTGKVERKNAQPIVVNHIKGIMALAHNGNLVNSEKLRRQLEMNGSIFHSTSDTEVISYIITRERLTAPSIELAINAAMYSLEGAYSLVIMSPSKLIAIRDPKGFRPLCYGKMKDGTYIVASESCALDTVGADFVRDVEPGEIIVFSKDGVKSIKDHCGRGERKACVFEYVYFSRPDSCVDGCVIHDARIQAGRFLAEEHPVDADIVVGVPDSGLDAALGYSMQSGIPYGIGFIKNKYIGRTFISPTQEMRKNQVNIKLNAISSTVKGKRVILIDDSIVRGTTSARIVKILREAGAKEVHMRVSAPPFINPCYYGTDIDSKEGLIAANKTMDEIRDSIGVDSLGYLSVKHVKQLTGGKLKDSEFCTACFDGDYPTRTPDLSTKNKFERKISENNRKETEQND